MQRRTEELRRGAELQAQGMSANADDLSIMGRIDFPVLELPVEVSLCRAPSQKIRDLLTTSDYKPTEEEVDAHRYLWHFVCWHWGHTTSPQLVTNTKNCIWEFLRLGVGFDDDAEANSCRYVDDDVLAFVRKYGPLSQMPDRVSSENKEYEIEGVFVYQRVAWQYQNMMDAAILLADGRLVSRQTWQAVIDPFKITDAEWEYNQNLDYQRSKLADRVSTMLAVPDAIVPMMKWEGGSLRLHYFYGYGDVDTGGNTASVARVHVLLALQLAAILSSPQTVMTCSICGNQFQTEKPARPR